MANVISFRECLHSDLQQIQPMVDDLYSLAPATAGKGPNLELTFNELTGKPDKGRIIVMDAGGLIVGYSIIIFFWSNEFAGNIIEVDELYVAESQRSGGIGTKFFRWVEQTFSENLSGLSLQVAHHNADALRFYQRQGFEFAKDQHLFRLLQPTHAAAPNKND